MQSQFLRDLLAQLTDFKRFPHYQFERRIDAFVGVFLLDFLTEIHNAVFSEIWPEFPVRSQAKSRKGNRIWSPRSLDYACYAPTSRLVVLVELKTDPKSVKPDQLRYYNTILARNWTETIDEIREMRKHSKFTGKYDYLIGRIAESEVERIEAAYLAPQAAKAKFESCFAGVDLAQFRSAWRFVSFTELADSQITTRYADEWKIVSQVLAKEFEN